MNTRSPFTDGMRLGVGPATATFALGLSFGAAASTAGWGIGLPLLFSTLAFSGSAQFALLTTISAGGAAAAIAAAILINARYVVMGLALNDSLRGNRLRRALQAQALADASFVVAHRGGGHFDIVRLVGATVPQWTAWVGGTAIGLITRPTPELLHNLGADVVFPAFFLMLALDEVRNSPRALGGAACGAVIAGTLLFMTEPGYALLAATAGALVGAVPTRQNSHDSRGS